MAKIKIDMERKRGKINQNIFGSFVEHLGRCVYEGIYDEDSPRSDEDNFRKDVIEAVQELNIPLLRWPGGNFVSGYHWMDGIGPVKDRPKKLELAWNTTESNKVGTDEFMDFCKKAGVEPYICVNMGNGTMEEAQNWIEYSNSNKDTKYGNLRRKNGHKKPYKVKYWGLGNEIYGERQIGHKEAEKYAKEAREYGKVLKRVDPSVDLIAVGAGKPEWDRKVLKELGRDVEYISTHLYLGNEENDYYKYMSSSERIESHLNTLESVIDSVMHETPKKERPKISFDEWNVMYKGWQEYSNVPREEIDFADLHEEVYNLEDALVVSMFLNSFIRHCDTVKMANQAQLVNVIGPIMTKRNDLLKQTIYYPFKIYAEHNSGYGLDVFVDCKSYESNDFEEVPYLDVSGSYNEEEEALILNVVNKHIKSEISVEIKNQSGDLDSTAEVYEVNGEDIKDRNTFEEKKQVDIEEKKVEEISNDFTYTFPPHSFTSIKFGISK